MRILALTILIAFLIGPSFAQTKPTSSKLISNKKVSRLIAAKRDFLSKHYDKPKVSTKKTTEDYNSHLDLLNNLCEFPENFNEEKFNKEMETFRLFLIRNLEDPYLNPSLTIQFRDILSITEGNPDPEAFSSKYKLLYNLDHDALLEQYPIKWVRVLYKCVECRYKKRL